MFLKWMDNLLLKCSTSRESIIPCGSAFQWRRVSQKMSSKMHWWSGEVMILSYFNRCVMWQTVYSFNNINIYKLTHEQNYAVSLLDRPKTSLSYQNWIKNWNKSITCTHSLYKHTLSALHLLCIHGFYHSPV